MYSREHDHLDEWAALVGEELADDRETADSENYQNYRFEAS